MYRRPACPVNDKGDGNLRQTRQKRWQHVEEVRSFMLGVDGQTNGCISSTILPGTVRVFNWTTEVCFNIDQRLLLLCELRAGCNEWHFAQDVPALAQRVQTKTTRRADKNG